MDGRKLHRFSIPSGTCSYGFSWPSQIASFRVTWSYRELAHDAAPAPLSLSLLCPRAGAVIHADRYLERHQRHARRIARASPSAPSPSSVFHSKARRGSPSIVANVWCTEKVLRDENPRIASDRPQPAQASRASPRRVVTERASTTSPPGSPGGAAQ